MKHFSRHHLAILPMLSVLMLTPPVMESKSYSRGIASIKEENKKHPKFDDFASKVKPEEIKNDENPSLENLKCILTDLKTRLSSERKKTAKDQTLKIESIVVEILSLEKDLTLLEDKKTIEKTASEEVRKTIIESKSIVETLINDREIKKEVVADSEEPKEEAKEEICEEEIKNRTLTSQMEDLVKQQNQVMQTLVTMAQMMLSMQQQQNQLNYSAGLRNSPYQYADPQVAGNWVYYPNGFRPNAPHIFAQPTSQDIYPDQLHRPTDPGWTLKPDQQFGAQSFVPGNFGNDGSSFNMTNTFPQLTQL